MPEEIRIITAHKLKLEKYQHFQTDINTLKVSVHPFEIGSHTGYISRENKETLSSIHKFCKKDIKLKEFKNNISAITILGSYFIFNNRNNETWHTPRYISKPMWIIFSMNTIFIQSRNHTIPAGRSVYSHITLSLRFLYFFIELLYFSLKQTIKLRIYIYISP